MKLPARFIGASAEYSSFEQHIPAPYLRKQFSLQTLPPCAEIVICGIGFYRLFINGKEVTKGYLAPYISATDDILYFDTYEIAHLLQTGENAVGILLGNGMQNAFGGYVWKFDEAPFRGAPRVSFKVTLKSAQGEITSFESDESVRTSPSPILFDELRCGEYYDSTREQPGWAQAGFDDSGWKPAVLLETPRGECRVCEAEPIVCQNMLAPVSITKVDDAYLYDFGLNRAGLCRLKVSGFRGQEISMEHGELLHADGSLNLDNISFVPPGYVQKDIFICNGEKNQEHVPSFTYHGFRYVAVKGIQEEQATAALLTYWVINSDLKERGNFACSCNTLNQLQDMTRASTLANFYYFPTDCPHREKNGWTGDASVSAEHTLLNLQPEKSYREWLRNIRKAQTEDGAFPGIVPTGGWGVDGWTGPAWDNVIVNLPYYTYLYRGELAIVQENKTAILRYLHFLSTKRDRNGLVGFGLGDWCHPARAANRPKAPEVVTDSILCMDMANKAAFLFEQIGLVQERDFAASLAASFKESIRNHLVDFSTMRVAGDCQTSQAMAIFYEVFTKAEAALAFQTLLGFIHDADDHMDTGILGARVLFHVLSDYGYSDLAYHLITTNSFPSYGNWIARGATSLWEDFQEEGGCVTSKNHHFFGDVSHWMMRQIAGIHVNPSKVDVSEVKIHPHFIAALSYAQAFHDLPSGRITVRWEKKGETILLTLQKPETVALSIEVDYGYELSNRRTTLTLSAGETEHMETITKTLCAGNE